MTNVVVTIMLMLALFVNLLNNYIVKKVQFIVFASLLMMIGCAKKENNAIYEVSILGDKNVVVDASDFISQLDSLELITKKDCYLSGVKDFAVSDSFLFVLDMSKRVFRFNRLNGSQDTVFSGIGHGHGEYIDPKGLSISGDSLFILDVQKQSVMVFDYNLNLIEEINMDFSVLDFAVVNNGFLFYNLDQSADKKRIVYTDRSGKYINSYLANAPMPEMLLAEKFFSHDEKGNVYFYDITSDKIYEWTEDSLSLFAQLSYGESIEGVNESESKTLSCLIYKNKILTSFLNDRFVQTNIFDRSSRTSVSGLVNTGKRIPFLPQKVFEETLFGIFECPFDESNPKTYLVSYK